MCVLLLMLLLLLLLLLQVFICAIIHSNIGGFEWGSPVQDASSEVLGKILKDLGTMTNAFALMAEHGPKQLKRYQSMFELELHAGK